MPDPHTVVVGLLVPLSGEDAASGRIMLQGAELAVFDLAGKRFELRPYDTKGNAQGARIAAEQALADGARLLLGPLFSESVAAVRAVARPQNVNVIAFTNDRSAAGDGVYVLGHLIQPQIDTVVAYARAHGIRRFAALVPDGIFGERAAEAIVSATKAYGGELQQVVTYSSNATSIDAAVRKLASYDQRKAALRDLRSELGRRKDVKALAMIDRLKNQDTLGDVDFDAVLVPSGSQSIRSIAARLPYYDIPSSKVRVLGISTWERLDLGREPALTGAWYATPSNSVRKAFEKRYHAAFDRAPDPLASLAYDATAVAAILSRRPTGPDFSAAALTDRRGFEGASGLFRFDPDGLSERNYAISEIGHDGVKMVSGARNSFDEAKGPPTEPPTRRSDGSTSPKIF